MVIIALWVISRLSSGSDLKTIEFRLFLIPIFPDVILKSFPLFHSKLGQLLRVSYLLLWGRGNDLELTLLRLSQQLFGCKQDEIFTVKVRQMQLQPLGSLNGLHFSM